MFKRRDKIIIKLLVLAMCTSLVPTTMAFAGENVTNVVQTTGGTVSVNSSVTNKSDFIFDSKTGRIGKYKGSKTEVVIPSEINGVSVTSIGDFAFSDCSSLTSITIPNSVTSIGNSAFSHCSSLTNIAIPNSVTSIGDSALYGCISLTRIDIPNSVTSIGDSTFSHCSNLTSIMIPDSVKSIGEWAFYWCFGLTSITLPNNLTCIGNSAFSFCIELKNITIPNSVKSIGECAFQECSSLTSIIIPNSLTSISYGAFSECSSLTSVTIPNSVTSIADYTFGNCSKAIFYVENEKIKNLLLNSNYAIDKSEIIVKSKSSTVKATGVKLNETSLSVVKGKTSKLTATVAPTNAINKAITWSSSNPKVATVDSNGKVTAAGAGTATITCTAKDGSKKSATCKVTVTNPVSVASVKLNKTSLSIGKGKTSKLIATVAPTNAINKAVTWSSSNTKVATIDQNGNIKGVAKGIVTITCIAKDGSKKSVTCKVTVTK